ncbi:DUF2969 domain-containing protein [Vagococcus carniphilus]|uniref:DUF2969 domain-containing protein n=1 Tax=Vagococcus carniphilus TaxID=218144 RepID=UPI00288F3412|nr:DUF2969 domain-containing protein [Vagococcus carniphilus]MDT2815581.1 DUF2969 domain-containing protein [Vagococcus carniphilus]
MMRKNKPVEVEIKETETVKDGKTIVCHQLFIGKKMIGEVLEVDSSKYEIKSEESFVGIAKTMDQGYEEVLRNWNLHN